MARQTVGAKSFTRQSSRNFAFAAALMAAAILPTALLHAATLTYVSSGTDGDLANAANFSPSQVPATGDDLIFNTSTVRALVNNLPDGTELNSFTNNGGGYTVAAGTGASISIATETSSATGSGAGITFNLPVVIPSTATAFTENVNGTYRVDFNSGITGTGDFDFNASVATYSSRLISSLPIGSTSYTYTGDTNVNSGTLGLYSESVLPSGYNLPGQTTGNLNIASGASVTVNNFNEQLNGLNGAGAVTKIGSNSRTLTVGNNNANGNFSGTLSWTGGSSSVTKIGTGSQSFGTLTTINFNANGGTSIINNTTTITTATAAAGATLAGTSVISGTVNNNGIIDPGASGPDSIGTLSVGNGVTFGASAAYDVDIGTAGNDLLAITGNLTLGAGDTLGVNLLAGVVGGTYTIATYTGTLSGTFANIPAGDTVDYGVTTPGVVTVTVSSQPVPEPASIGLLAWGAGSLLVRRRRNRI